MTTVLAVAKMIVVRLAYVGLGVTLAESIRKVKNRKNKKEE